MYTTNKTISKLDNQIKPASNRAGDQTKHQHNIWPLKNWCTDFIVLQILSVTNLITRVILLYTYF